MTNTNKIAACNICLLGLKDCASCPFNPGKLSLKPGLTPAERLQVARIELLGRCPQCGFSEKHLASCALKSTVLLPMPQPAY